MNYQDLGKPKYGDILLHLVYGLALLILTSVSDLLHSLSLCIFF